MKNWRGILFGLLGGLLFTGIILLVASHPYGNAIQLLPPPTPEPMVIYVTGAVQKPGVYSIPINSRVIDAINLAGGLLPSADENSINLASKIKDGDKILIPFKRQTQSPGGTPAVPPQLQTKPIQPATPSPSFPININSASIEELDTLPGIGPTKAQQIIIYREKNGAFSKPEDVQKVEGIGPSLFAQIKDLITTNP
jgi:competence protein ComEA